MFLVSFLGVRFLFEFFIFSFLGLDLSFVFVFDFLSLGFFSCVSFISGVVFLYSVFYISNTIDLRRFGYLVFLFVLSMIFLVFSGNFIITMVGWDGLGLVSFCLVIFYPNSSSLESGLVTVFSNRVGDVFFLLCFFFFFLSGCLTWDLFSGSTFFVFFIFLFFGAITKRAQVPFSAWLPAAIAAPTPVSSLVHSSTLVTAGVYVLIRFNYLFRFFVFNYFKFFFVLTMLLAGVCAVLERDFKKVVAMSTLSQLGIMLFILSVGCWVLSFLHIIIHAFFKSILFLRTGSLMMQMEGGQESRFYGRSNINYFSFIYFSVRRLCLSGFPFFLGFYSKDFIISSFSVMEGFLFFFIFILGCLITVIYRIRLVWSSYMLIFKFSGYFFSIERKVFFIPVTGLFLKCWALGGFMYWLFLSEFRFFFSFFDLFIGLLLFFFGLVIYFFFHFFYELFFVFRTFAFLRWKFSSGISFYIRKTFLYNFEGTWMEILGGVGVHSYLLKMNKVITVFGFFGLGITIFFFVFILYFL